MSAELTPQSKAIETLFHIQDKEGRKVPFKLNPSQRAFDQIRLKGRKNIITKARQKGFSAFVLALFAIDCLGKEGTRAVVISHEGEATQRLLARVHYYIRHMNGPKPVPGRTSRNELYFPKTESSFYIGTAGARAFGRGDTITHLHISEYAWWEGDATRHVAGLWQAVPKTGQIYVESTGNGRANDFFEMYRHHKRLGFNLFFRSWWEDNEYSLPAPEDWAIKTPWVEPAFMKGMLELHEQVPQLTNDQLYWYYLKLMEFRGNWNMMRQEYPTRVEECFQATGGSIFPDVESHERQEWTMGRKFQRFCNWLEGHPKQGWHYVLGADPSGGTGNDAAVIEVFCVETLEQVFEFGDNHTNPVQFAWLIHDIGKYYNEAYLVVEANNHGISTLAVLKESYPRTQIFKRSVTAKSIKYGWQTTNITKPQIAGLTNEMLEEGLVIHSTTLRDAMLSFEEDVEGKMEGKEDHYVIACMLACLGLRKKEVIRTTRPDLIIVKPKTDLDKVDYTQSSFEDIMSRIRPQGHSQLFRRQVGGY